jgi:hypothetical protein
MLSYRTAAQTALDVQDACNLSGVVYSFSQAVTAIWDEAHMTGKGSDWVNSHPIVTLFLDKLVSLNGNIVSDVRLSYADAYVAVERIAREG